MAAINILVILPQVFMNCSKGSASWMPFFIEILLMGAVIGHFSLKLQHDILVDDKAADRSEWITTFCVDFALWILTYVLFFYPWQ